MRYQTVMCYYANCPSVFEGTTEQEVIEKVHQFYRSRCKAPDSHLTFDVNTDQITGRLTEVERRHLLKTGATLFRTRKFIELMAV